MSFSVLAGINHCQISTGESFNLFLPLKSSPSLVVRKWFDSRSNVPQLKEILSNRSPGFLNFQLTETIT